MRFLFIVLCLVTLVAACKKNTGNGNSGSSNRISNEEQSVAAFNTIDSVWENSIENTLGTEQGEFKYSNKVLQNSSGGQATVNGTRSATGTGSYYIASGYGITDVSITFQDYNANGTILNGVLTVYLKYNFRDCSSSLPNCKELNDRSLKYTSKKLSIKFSYNGKNIADEIALTAIKEQTKSSTKPWDINITNSANQVYAFEL
jgi:hypothetical protein